MCTDKLHSVRENALSFETSHGSSDQNWLWLPEHSALPSHPSRRSFWPDSISCFWGLKTCLESSRALHRRDRREPFVKSVRHLAV